MIRHSERKVLVEQAKITSRQHSWRTASKFWVFLRSASTSKWRLCLSLNIVQTWIEISVAIALAGYGRRERTPRFHRVSIFFFGQVKIFFVESKISEKCFCTQNAETLKSQTRHSCAQITGDKSIFEQYTFEKSNDGYFQKGSWEDWFKKQQLTVSDDRVLKILEEVYYSCSKVRSAGADNTELCTTAVLREMLHHVSKQDDAELDADRQKSCVRCATCL